MNATATRKSRNFCTLYLAMENSSVITSMVAMYMNVPAEMEVNMPEVKGPESLMAHPIPMPIGFMMA